MRRTLWVVALAAAIVAILIVIRGVSQMAQQSPKEDHAGGGIVAGAPLRVVCLYFGAPDRVALMPEERAILDPGGPEKLAEAIAREVLRGPARGVGVTGFSPETRVRAFYLDTEGTGYLDLSEDFLDRWPQGDGLEWVSLGSLVRSLTGNVPGLRSVYILVEGRTVDRSPGSIPLDLPLEPDAFGAATPGEAGVESPVESDSDAPETGADAGSGGGSRSGSGDGARTETKL